MWGGRVHLLASWRSSSKVFGRTTNFATPVSSLLQGWNGCSITRTAISASEGTIWLELNLVSRRKGIQLEGFMVSGRRMSLCPFEVMRRPRADCFRISEWSVVLSTAPPVAPLLGELGGGVASSTCEKINQYQVNTRSVLQQTLTPQGPRSPHWASSFLPVLSRSYWDSYRPNIIDYYPTHELIFIESGDIIWS